MKWRSLLLLVLAEVAAMSLWFVSAAIAPDMQAEFALSTMQTGLLSAAVQLGFVVGALGIAITGLADRLDPRAVFAACAILAGGVNAALLVLDPASFWAVAARFLTGLLLAGVYPVGMKIAVGWGQKDRGFLVGLLVGALTLGSALPHLIAFTGGADWRLTVKLASGAAALGGLLVLAAKLGPFHAKASRFNPAAIKLAWTNRQIRYAYAGYLGHMWELYAMWAWIGAASAVPFAAHLPAIDAAPLAKLTAFIAIGAGAISCAAVGPLADRFGKARLAQYCLLGSGLSALAFAAFFTAPPIVITLIAVIWGLTIIPDSAQFSALVADYAPPEQTGSLLTLQTALGFLLTFATVQLTPVLAEVASWRGVALVLALGPAFGWWSMQRLRRLAD